MNSEIDDAAATIIELTNTVGASAVGIQNSAQAARTVRRVAAGAARHPERLAAVGLGLLVTASVLALGRNPAGKGSRQN